MFSCFTGQRAEEIGYGYKIVKRLGKGATGSVYLARNGSDEAAIKLTDVHGPRWLLDMTEKECNTFANCFGSAAPTLVKCHEVRLTPHHVQLVLEHCSGGTLEAYCKRKRVNEDTACYFFHQLINALQHLHRSKIAYRDMKLQNVLLASKPSKNKPPRLVLCDLGTAKCWTDLPKCDTFVGTPGFMSPQVLASMFNTRTNPVDDDSSSHHSGTSKSTSSHCYDARKADIWAVGALLHYMLHRQLPYGYDSFAPLLPPVEALMTLYHLENRHTWKDAAGAHGLQPISAEAQDLLDQLLHPDEAQRISIRKIKQHPWYKRKLPQQYEHALEEQRKERQQLSCSAAEEAVQQQCRQMAADAVDLLFELSRCPEVLQRLQQEGRCLSVPLSPFGLPAAADQDDSTSGCARSALARAQQQLQQVKLDLLAEAHAVGLSIVGCQQASVQDSVASVVLQKQQAKAAAGGNVAHDDTCFELQVNSCS